MAVFIPVECPACFDTKNIVKFGYSKRGEQRYWCRNDVCKRRTFILHVKNKGCLSHIKKQIIEMTLNGSGIRDIARVLGISKNTVASEIKKKQASSKQLMKPHLKIT